MSEDINIMIPDEKQLDEWFEKLIFEEKAREKIYSFKPPIINKQLSKRSGKELGKESEEKDGKHIRSHLFRLPQRI